MQFNEAVGVTGLVLTKLDGTAKGGIVLAIARKLGLPIRFIGVASSLRISGSSMRRHSPPRWCRAQARKRGWARRGLRLDDRQRNDHLQKIARAPAATDDRRKMIVFDKVAKRYPNGREALAGVSLRINPGEMVFLTGKSGRGKSSVLKLIALLERPTRGMVLINGRNTSTLRPAQIPAFRRNIGVVFQDHKMLADRPVYDNVALPLIVSDTPMRGDRQARARIP